MPKPTYTPTKIVMPTPYFQATNGPFLGSRNSDVYHYLLRYHVKQNPKGPVDYTGAKHRYRQYM
jgi:hypothetical protein